MENVNDFTITINSDNKMTLIIKFTDNDNDIVRVDPDKITNDYFNRKSYYLFDSLNKVSTESIFYFLKCRISKDFHVFLEERRYSRSSLINFLNDYLAFFNLRNKHEHEFINESFDKSLNSHKKHKRY